ncbi:MAG: DNA-3-methyladenine glycosylase I [Granulosicoccus sp.]
MPSAVPETCAVPDNDTEFQQYHDHEWGVPTCVDQVFFEKVCLEGFQSGLSWRTILHRRAALRQAFDDFIPERVAVYTQEDVKRLMHNEHIIRNRRKIESAINNAQRFLELQSIYGSAASFFWRFEPSANQRPGQLNRQWLKHNTSTPQSISLAKTLKNLGWSFVGPTNMYALMQALGLVNDHVEGCPRRASIEVLRHNFNRPE